MNTNRPLIIIALLALGAVASAAAQPNAAEFKQRVLAQARGMSADDFAFTRTVRTEQTSNGKTEKRVAIEKFDPSKPADARWTLVSVNGAPPSADELNDFRKDVAKRTIVPGYHWLAGYFGTPATTSTDARGRTVFRFTALPNETVKVMDSDVSQNATAEVSVSEVKGAPFAEEVRITLKPMRLKLVMKIERFESTARYRMGPDGRPLLVEQISDMTGSGMGQEGRFHTETTYSDHRSVGHLR
ncbi:MAG: hypothetical protein ABI674_00770 [Spartobacteria bacterium]